MNVLTQMDPMMSLIAYIYKRVFDDVLMLSITYHSRNLLPVPTMQYRENGGKKEKKGEANLHTPFCYSPSLEIILRS